MKITLTRVEGPTALCNKPKVVDTFAAANRILSDWSMLAPKKDEGYDKCDFEIESDEPKITYLGRYDLVHFSVKVADLKGHVLGNLGQRHVTLGVYEFFKEHE